MPQNPSILFVDDEERLLNGLLRRLAQRQPAWRLEAETQPEAALKRLSTGEVFEALITDFSMPRKDGLELIQEARASGFSRPAILLTGVGDLDLACRAINEASVFRFLTKPVPLDDLESAVLAAIAEAEPSSETGSEVLDCLSQAVLIVDDSGLVERANAAASALLSSDDALGIDRDGRLRGATPQLSQSLHAYLAVAGLPDQNLAPLAIPRRLANYPLAATAVALGTASDRRRLALFLTDPEKRMTPAPETLSALFGLTASEARLASSLGAGNTLETAAGLQGLTVSSARTYLKTIFGKTGTNRQADLVGLLAALPASLVPAEGSDGQDDAGLASEGAVARQL